MTRRSDAELAVADGSEALRGQREYMDALIPEQPQLRRELPVHVRLHTPFAKAATRYTWTALQSRIQFRAIWCPIYDAKSLKVNGLQSYFGGQRLHPSEEKTVAYFGPIGRTLFRTSYPSLTAGPAEPDGIT